MSENILSVEDLKFLELLYLKHGVQSFEVYDNDIKIHMQRKNSDHILQEKTTYLSEISKKLRYRLNSNFQLIFTQGCNFDVVRI